MEGNWYKYQWTIKKWWLSMKSCACVCMIQAPSSIRVIFMPTEVKRSKIKKIIIFRLRFISSFMEGKSIGCLLTLNWDSSKINYTYFFLKKKLCAPVPSRHYWNWSKWNWGRPISSNIESVDWQRNKIVYHVQFMFITASLSFHIF